MRVNLIYLNNIFAALSPVPSTNGQGSEEEGEGRDSMPFSPSAPPF